MSERFTPTSKTMRADNKALRTIEYGIAILVVAGTFPLQRSLSLWIAPEDWFPLLLIASIGISYFCGIGPGLLSTGLAAFSTTAIALGSAFALGDVSEHFYLKLGLFVFEGGLVSLLAGGRRFDPFLFQGQVQQLQRSQVTVTQLTQAQQNLQVELQQQARQEKALAEQLTDSSVDGIVALDRNCCYTFWNPAMERISGVSKAEVLGQCAFEIFPFLKETGEDQYILAALSGGAMMTSDRYYKIPATGREGFFEGYYSPIYSETGEITGALGIIRDVTERHQAALALRKAREVLEVRIQDRTAELIRANRTLQAQIVERQQAEAALRISEAKFRRLVESNVVGVMVADHSGNITEANDALLQMLGYTQAELRSGQLSWRNMTPPQYLPKDEDAIAEIKGTGACTPFEKEYICKDGQRVPILLGCALLDSPDETTICFVLDLSELKRSETALRESEERFRQLAEKVRVIPWEADATTWKFTYVGPQTVEILGYPLEDWYADHFWAQHIHPEDRDWVVKYCLDCSTHLENYEFEYRMLTASGQALWLYDIVHVVLENDGPKLLRGFMIDITERKQVEEEKAQLLEREQTARLAAETANRMKDEFLAVLSHELRSPLNAILGWSKLLQARRFDATTTTRALETIERNARLQTQLIEDLLDVSRMIQGKLRLQIQPLNLAPILEAALDTVHLAAAAKMIRLEASLDAEVGAIAGDSDRLQQVFWNLLANAIKFTPEAGLVTLRLEQVGSQAQIQVSDTGVGICPDFLPHIFERFRQADSTTTRAHGGLGLGLSIVRHLVELHGGTVTADSPGENQGATFTVQLPLLKETACHALEPNSVLEQMPTSHYYRASQESANFTEVQLQMSARSLQGLRVLVVDDEADTRNYLSQTLEQCGASVAVAASVREALAVLPSLSPDVLISDIGMPGEDGYSLIRQIRIWEAEQGSHVVAAALTAYAKEEDHTQAIAAGFEVHIAKPVEPTTLVTAIAQLTGRMDESSSPEASLD